MNMKVTLPGSIVNAVQGPQAPTPVNNPQPGVVSGQILNSLQNDNSVRDQAQEMNTPQKGALPGSIINSSGQVVSQPEGTPGNLTDGRGVQSQGDSYANPIYQRSDAANTSLKLASQPVTSNDLFSDKANIPGAGTPTNQQQPLLPNTPSIGTTTAPNMNKKPGPKLVTNRVVGRAKFAPFGNRTGFLSGKTRNM
jgi:hypothetical protein